jgi:uroporphyrinogen-III synthase
MANIQSILVSQPPPEKGKKSPFQDLAVKHDLKVDFRSFIHIEEVEVKEFRQQKLNLEDYTAVILTSRNAIDHYFRICKEARFTVPDTMKYFCTSEAIALYLQKYVVYRKRKIFFGGRRFPEVVELMKKHKKENFLLPTADILRPIVPKSLEDAGIQFTRSVLFRTVVSDLSDLEDVFYDMLVFYSPAGIESLYKNFPDFKQKKTKVAVFGETTRKAAVAQGIEVNVAAPDPKVPSMTGAIDLFIRDKF